MKKLLLGLAATGLLLLLVLAGAVLWWFDGEKLRPQLQDALSSGLGRSVNIGSLRLELLQGQLSAGPITIADDAAFGSDPFVEAQALEVSLQWWHLLSEQAIRIDTLRLREPLVRLRQNAKGEWNFASLGAAKASEDTAATTDNDAAAKDVAVRVGIDQIEVSDGRLLLTFAGGSERSYQQLQLQVDEFDPASEFPFKLRAQAPAGGGLQIEGRFGPLVAGDALKSALQAQIKVSGLDLAASGFVGPKSSIRGKIDFVADIRSEQGVMHSKGRLQAQALRLLGEGEPAAVPVILDYSAEYDLGKRRGTLSAARLGSEDAGINVDGRFDHRQQTLRVVMAATAEALPVAAVQALLPAFGVRLPADSTLRGGQLQLNLSIRGPLDGLVIEGPVQLTDTHLDGFSLGDKVGTALALAGVSAPDDTHLRQASLELRSSPRGLQLQQIDADVTALGTLRGEANMASDGELDGAMRIWLAPALVANAGGGALSGSGLGRFTGGTLEHASRNGIAFALEGRIDAPEFKPDRGDVSGAIISGLLQSRSKDRDDEDPDAEKDDDLESLLGGLLRKKRKD